ncbi:hypothetical protein quinque_006148 [Culex quinquefasciatus]
MGNLRLKMRWIRRGRLVPSVGDGTFGQQQRGCTGLRWKTNQAFREFHATNELLYARLRTAYDELLLNPGSTAEVNKIKGEMLLLQNRFSKAFERINDKFVAGEKISSFQLADRNTRKKKSAIDSIRHRNRLLTDPSEVQNHILDYYKTLYSLENSAPNTNFPTNRAIPPGSNSNERMMEEITTEEIYFAIKSSASRKSPGSDGVPKEFYLRASRHNP